MSAPIPCGYIRLTSSFDGRPFLLGARELSVMPGSGTPKAGHKYPDGCLVGPITDTESYWICAETFDEVQAALVVALGAQDEAPAPMPLRMQTMIGCVNVPPEQWPIGVERRLMSAGFCTVEQLAAFTRNEVASRRNIGTKVMEFCDAALAAHGLNWKANPNA